VTLTTFLDQTPLPQPQTDLEPEATPADLASLEAETAEDLRLDPRTLLDPAPARATAVRPPTPKADATYEVSKGKAVTGPDKLSAGHHVIAVHRDASGDVLEPGIFKLDDGKTVEEFAKAVKVFDEGPLPKGAAALLPGAIVIGEFDFGTTETVYFGVDLEPGKYVKAADWVGREKAEAELQASVDRFKAAGHWSVAGTAPRRDPADGTACAVQ
jgi:hypothetical protein